jgi:hypothetical protein
MRQDIALENNDLFFSNGDFVVAQSDEQHIIDTINCFQGWWKENPFDGVGLMQYMKSNAAMQEINRSVKMQLQGDGYILKSNYVNLDAAGKLIINTNVNI